MKIDKNHRSKKIVFRIVGICSLVIGIILIAFFIGSFFDQRGQMGDNIFPISRFNEPRIDLAFIGMPLIFIGFLFTSLGFAGDVLRYQAEEVAPVSKDVINYMVDGTKDSIKTVVRSIKEGLSNDDTSNQKVICVRCQTENDSDAKYCDNCGNELEHDKICPKCKAINDYKASYCDNCGTRL